MRPPLPAEFQPRFRIDVQKDLVGQLRALLSQPLLQRNRLAVVRALVADEDAQHADPPMPEPVPWRGS
jgi:hypothetical protein